MELTAKHHRQIHYLLLFINIIGLILLSIAIVVTYLNKPKRVPVQYQSEIVCPTFFPTEFHQLEDSDFFTNAPFIVEILDDEHDGSVECIGVLVTEKSVLTSRRCLENVLYEAEGISMKPAVRHRNATTGETVTIAFDSYEYPKTYKQEIAFHDNLALLFLTKKFDDVEVVKIKEEYGSDTCDNIEKHNLTLVQYRPNWRQNFVTGVSQSECQMAWREKDISENEFCVVDNNGKNQFFK